MIQNKLISYFRHPCFFRGVGILGLLRAASGGTHTLTSAWAQEIAKSIRKPSVGVRRTSAFSRPPRLTCESCPQPRASTATSPLRQHRRDFTAALLHVLKCDFITDVGMKIQSEKFYRLKKGWQGTEPASIGLGALAERRSALLPLALYRTGLVNAFPNLCLRWIVKLYWFIMCLSQPNNTVKSSPSFTSCPNAYIVF